MKRIKSGLSLVIAVVMCLSLLPMTALARGEIETGEEFVIENGVLIGYNGAGGHVVIPDGVTQIGSYNADNAASRGGLPFYNHRNTVTGVTIPNSVTRINAHSFDGISNLTSITIPNSVTYIGDGAFHNTGLTSVTIPNSVTYIGDVAFMNCNNLTSATIGNSVTSIGSEAFAFSRLTSVTIPNSVTTIGYCAFRECTDLTSVTIGNGIKNYVSGFGRNGIFTNCTSLTSVTIVNGLTTITDYMFYSIPNLTSITIPDSVTSIGAEAFYDADLRSVTIPNGVTSIGRDAFYNNRNLTTVTIPDSVTYIGDGAFHISDTANSVSRANPNIIIHGITGSAAETYAKEQGYKFVSTGGTIPTDPPKTETAPNIDNASGWAKPFVNEAYNNGLIPSTLQSNYTQATTRAEFCALAVALYETIKGAEITDRKTFDDTNDINVQKMAGLGVVTGVGNNKFDPNAKLTREQAAVMIARLFEALGKPLAKQASTFADNGNIATWAIEAVGQIQAAGIISGTGNNMFSPKSDYTREQSITTMNRLYGVLK